MPLCNIIRGKGKCQDRTPNNLLTNNRNKNNQGFSGIMLYNFEDIIASSKLSSFIIFFVAVTYSYVAFAASSSNNDTNSDYKLCTTQDCVNEASRISNYIDRTVDPCDNFYKFACGRWIKNNPANISYPKISVSSMLNEKTLTKLKKILEDVPRSDDTLSLEKARKLYNMCMDSEELKKIGFSTLRKVVQKNGGWPMTMSAREWKCRKRHKTWQRVSDTIHDNLMSNGLYEISVTVDDKNPDINIITIEEPNLFISRDILISFEEEKMDHISFIEAIANNFLENRRAHVCQERIRQDAVDIVNFEIELVKLTLNFEDSKNIEKLYNLLTIEELQKAYDAQHPKKSKINWLRCIQRLFAPERITINSSEKLIVQAYKYLTSLVPLLERTPSRTIVNYMQWSIIRDLLPYTEHTEKIAVPLAKSKVSDKSPKESLRWKSCLEKDANLHTAISQEYAKRYVQLENKKDISDIITDITNAVREQITASTWMDEPTKKTSLEKLKNMRKKILIPDWFSNEAIDKYYYGLTVTSEYLESVINIFKFEFKKGLRKLRKPVDKNEWLTEPTTVNAYYNPPYNEIVISAGILQNPVYDKNRPTFMNYGALGVVAGHELNHGFDNRGRMYDENGKYIEWWTQKIINKYEKLTQCFIDQYNSYLVPGLEKSNVYVNGRLSLGENMADSAGLVTAYRAYRNRKVRLNEPELRLQGLEEYNDEQIFFMGFAQIFCQNVIPQEIELLRILDEHPLPEARIRGSYSNFPEFSKAYNCPAGKGMNPDKKCTLWQ